ncbi:MAG TPA: esterase-like activity of phytase family protein, partial [Myxococcota bacterium]|nr:esterase-like activity of phytase family protein [Myxococcota bacterium]
MTTVRSLLALGAALALGLAGPGCDAAGAPDGGADGATDGGAFRVVGFTDLPSADPRSHELSGLGWDEGAQTLWAVTNGAARLHRLLPDADFTGFTLADGLAVTGAGPWDGEGLARAAAGFYCANELGPAVLPVDGAGAAGAGIALPAHFAQARSNKSLESLSLSPDGRTLFTMNEAALSSDGPLATATGGTRLRLLRVELTTGAQTERAYLTDPL